jgi:hypothetical protein
MIDRQTIRIAEARTASHAAVFQIRAAEYDRTPEDRPIAKAIAAAALRRERAALQWAGERLATIRKYAAYEGIRVEQPAPVEQPAATVDADRLLLECLIMEQPAEEQAAPAPMPRTRRTTRNRAAVEQPATVDAAPVEIEPVTPFTHIPRRKIRGSSGLYIIAREQAKTTPPAARTPAQDALIQSKTAYSAMLAEGYQLRQAEQAADLEQIEACRIRYNAATEHYREIMIVAQPAIDAAAE